MNPEIRMSAHEIRRIDRTQARPIRPRSTMMIRRERLARNFWRLADDRGQPGSPMRRNSLRGLRWYGR